MNEHNKSRFKVHVDRIYPGAWSFGVCLSHADKETYLLFNIFVWSVSIGYMY